MIVPQYWAEKRLQHRARGRQVTVRRFGWSDDSPEDAQAMADLRAAEGLERVLAFKSNLRSEPRVPYNGAQGVPIREEIISRHGETIITRNSYGALCLNTPNVLFVDVDFENSPGPGLMWMILGPLLLMAVIAAWLMKSVPVFLAIAAAAFVVTRLVAILFHLFLSAWRGGAEASARRRVEKFIEQNPNWSLRVYRTPAGLRLLAMQQTFDPNDPAVCDCFHALGADPVYVQMCLNQQCFRARVSPKPWRVGVARHMRPQPGVWPVAPERMEIRNVWIAEYEAACPSFASCHFEGTLGSGASHAETRRVQELHDELSRANSSLPIA